LTELILLAHRTLPTAILVYLSIAGIWGIVEHSRGAAALSPTYAGMLVLAEALTVAQGLAGLYALLTGHPLDDPLHIVYGTLTVGLLPAVFAYASKRRRVALWMGITCLVVVAAALRGMTTG
jgi:hypothetical protein